MLIAKNKKALFNNEVLEKYVAGVVLKGYEVKAIREKNVSFEGSYVSIDDGGVNLVGMHIGRYSKQSQDLNEDNTKRTRALLLTKIELRKLRREIREKGKTAVPLALLLKHGRVKLEFAVVKGRKQHQKKQVLKDMQVKKDLEKEIRSYKNL